MVVGAQEFFPFEALDYRLFVGISTGETVEQARRELAGKGGQGQQKARERVRGRQGKG